jgi:general secretion pathway protein J
MTARAAPRGFTLIELLAALLILSLLSLMSYRGLSAVLDARAHVARETANWQRVTAFGARFAQDVQLASANPARGAAAWLGRSASANGPRLEFNRFATADGGDVPRRVAYALNEKREIELWLWPGIDAAPENTPARYALLSGVTKLDIEYLNAELVWVAEWPAAPGDVAMPRAVRLRLAFVSGGEVVRVFALSA